MTDEPTKPSETAIETADDIFDDIISRMKKYHPSQDFSIVERAYELAEKAHHGQTRASGEYYIIHPLEVARILTTIEMDRDTIAAAILHDVIEDTRLESEDLMKTFNPAVASLVDGVTKLDAVNYNVDENYDPIKAEEAKEASKEASEAGTYRKMLLATVTDPRVIIIKIADRLHNMRTIKHMPPNHKKRKADETLAIYAPLASRLGIAKLRYELEDLAFRYQDPIAYQDLKERILFKQNERAEYIGDLVRSIHDKLKEYNLKAEVLGRPKHFFSIYKKMRQKDKTLDEIYDLYAVRVLTDSVGDCYYALGAVHEMYLSVPNRFKDYISMPKPNKYQSIHNTLIGPGGEPFEIQIRTFEMDKVSEYGVAAHWKYKSGDSSAKDDEVKLDWLRQIMEWQRDLEGSSEFLNELKSELNPYRGQIYCFTPKGSPVELVDGATPIDFAYSIHSAIGNKMVGAKVNGRMAPLDTELKTGDQVEILTSNNAHGPNRDWLRLCKTTNSRAKINAWFKKQNKSDNIVKGTSLLEEAAKTKGMTLKELSDPRYISAVLRRYSYLDWETLLSSIGHGGISENQVINRLHGEYLRLDVSADDKDEQIIQLVNESHKKDDKPGGSGFIIDGAKDIAVRLSHCCSPMPGDEIVGFTTRGRGVSIHRSDCVNIINLDEVSRRQVKFYEWAAVGETKDRSFFASLDIITSHRPGIVSDISRLFTDDKINMESINTYKIKGDVMIRVAFPVAGKEHLERMMAKIRSISGIYEVKRTIS